MSGTLVADLERASCQANGIYFAVRGGCSVQTLRNLLDVIQDLKHVQNHHSLVGLNPNDELPELVLFDVMSSVYSAKLSSLTQIPFIFSRWAAKRVDSSSGVIASLMNKTRFVRSFLKFEGFFIQ